MDLDEAVVELRKEYCGQCNDQFTMEEIENGAKCEICIECEETGRMVARLQD